MLGEHADIQLLQVEVFDLIRTGNNRPTETCRTSQTLGHKTSVLRK